jgi:hypothetical protein
MRAVVQLLSPYLMKFAEFFINPAKILENPGKSAWQCGGDTLWTKISEKLNYYVKENTGEMSAL